MKQFIRTAVHAIKREIKKTSSELEMLIFRQRIHNKGFSIVSSNCWGSRIYQEMGLPYNTPFAGLFIAAPCYIKLLGDLTYCLESKIEFTDVSRYPVLEQDRRTNNCYPVGLLRGDVEIHFQHYHSEKEAREKWSRRLKRMNMNNLFVSFTDRDFCTKEHLQTFDTLPFDHKICFTAQPYPEIKSSVYLPEYKGHPHVGELYSNHHISRKYFDIPDWLNGGSGTYKLSNPLGLLGRSFTTQSSGRS